MLIALPDVKVATATCPLSAERCESSMSPIKTTHDESVLDVDVLEWLPVVFSPDAAVGCFLLLSLF